MKEQVPMCPATFTFDYEVHPLANTFPVIGGAPFEKLKKDIAEHGLLQPIYMFEGKILDGRSRFAAAKAVGYVLTPRDFREFYGSEADAEAFVISTNLYRRHLTKAQKQAFAKTLIAKYPYKSDRALCRLTGMSKNTIEAARAAIANSPEQHKYDGALKAWNALTDEQQLDFVLEHEADIRDILVTEAGNLAQ